MAADKIELINTRTHCMDLDSDETMVHSLDLSGTIIDVSPAWLNITGFAKGDVLGKHFIEFLDLQSLTKIEKNFIFLKDFGFVDNLPLNIMRKDRGIIPVVLTGTSKYTDEGQFIRTFCEMKFTKTETSNKYKG